MQDTLSGCNGTTADSNLAQLSFVLGVNSASKTLPAEKESSNNQSTEHKRDKQIYDIPRLA